MAHAFVDDATSIKRVAGQQRSTRLGCLEAARTSREQLRALTKWVQSLPFAACVSDSERRIICSSATFRRFVAHSALAAELAELRLEAEESSGPEIHDLGAVTAQLWIDSGPHVEALAVRMRLPGGMSLYILGPNTSVRRAAEAVIVPPDRLAHLSPRERAVLEALVGGMSNKAIGRSLGISDRTVEVHRRHVYRKLEVDGIAGALRLALAAGLGPERADEQPPGED